MTQKSYAHLMVESTDPAIRAKQEQITLLEAKLAGADADAIVQRHIRLLHTYNEIKDGAQSLIGRYAVATTSTVTEVHEQLGLSLTE